MLKVDRIEARTFAVIAIGMVLWSFGRLRKQKGKIVVGSAERVTEKGTVASMDLDGGDDV